MKLTKIFGIVLSLHVGVILLVMFQPGCQTIEKKDSENLEENNKEAKEDIGSFNSGVSDAKLPVVIPPPPGELKEPTRPVVGELFVPGTSQDVVPVPLPNVINEGEAVSNSFNLRPSNLSVYKIQKGDTLWGIARKKNVTLNSVLSSNPNLSKDSRLKIGQEVMIPSSDSISSELALPDTFNPINVPEGSSTYTIRGGDNLSRIANLHNIPFSELLKENGLNVNSVIRPGQVLIIPKGSLLKPTSTLSSTGGNLLSNSNTHKVIKGENLTRIASIYGTTVKQIMEWNGLTDAGKIRIGQSLVVSSSSINSSSEASEVPNVPVDSTPAKLQDFFNGVIEERPVIDVPEQP
jgi:LysM repeat protein